MQDTATRSKTAIDTAKAASKISVRILHVYKPSPSVLTDVLLDSLLEFRYCQRMRKKVEEGEEEREIEDGER